MAEKKFSMDKSEVTTDAAVATEVKTEELEVKPKVDTNEVLRKAREAEFDRNKKRIERKAEILSEYGNLESMIPLGHEYWNLGS